MRNHAIRLRREEVQKRLGVEDDEIIFETEEPSIEVSAEEMAIIKRGLAGLHGEIEEWMKPKKTLRFLPGAGKPNPHAHHGTTKLSQINVLMRKLEDIK